MDDYLEKFVKFCGTHTWVVFLAGMGAVCVGPTFFIKLEYYVLVIGVIVLHYFRDKIRDKMKDL